MQHSKAEIMLRAVRDNFADALSTLPGLLQDAEAASIYFYMANMSNMRKTLFPGFVSAYDDWATTGDTRKLEQLVHPAANHWQSLAEACIDLYKKNRVNNEAAMIALIEANTL